MNTKLTLLLVASFAAPLASQQNIRFTETSASGVAAGAFPLGAVGVRQQQLYPQAVIGPNAALIQDLYFAARLDRNGVYQESEVYYDDIEIRMGLVPISTLTTSWATNLPNPTYVYRGPLRIKFARNQWMAVGLPEPFIYAPTSPNDNLVIDIIVWSVADMGALPPDVNGYFMFTYSATTRNIERAHGLGWTSSQPATARGTDTSGPRMGFLLNDGNFVAHGGGCQSSAGAPARIDSPAGTWPQIGQPFTTELHDGPLGGVAFLDFGVNFRMAGSRTLPFDLGVFGAPSCFAWHDSITTAGPVATDPSGFGSYTLTIPANNGLIGLRFYNTWYGIDPPANSFGLVTSGYGTIIIGT